MYHMFNWISGYKVDNPSVKSIQWRLILLESVAGVPGFVAAGFHHFKRLSLLFDVLRMGPTLCVLFFVVCVLWNGITAGLLLY